MTMFDRIKETAKKRGLSLNQLNDKAEFKPNVIYSWKTKNPSMERVAKVASVLHVSVDYLLGKTDDPETKTQQSDKSDIDLEKEIAKGRTVRWEGREIPPEEWEMFRRIMEGGK